MISSDGVMPYNSPQHLLGALTHPQPPLLPGVSAVGP